MDVYSELYHPTKDDLKQYDKMSIVMLCPMMNPERKWVRCMANMMAYSWMHGLKIYAMAITEKVVVDWARNDLAGAALHKKNDYTGKYFTHFFWLDDDHVFNPDAGVVLAKHFAQSTVDGVSAVYYHRHPPTVPVIYVKDETEDYTHYTLAIIPKMLVNVDAFGFGCCMMKRDIFLKVEQPWFTIDAKGGEDIVFCHKARTEYGIKWWCDGTYRIGHIGEAPIVTHQTYLDHMEENKEAYADRVKITLDGGPRNARKQ